MNATVQIIAQLYCYPEFRVAAHSRDATSSKTDAHTEFRHTFIEMLDNYHKPQTKMNDNQFRDYYHYTFLTTMDKIQFFNICKGDFTLDVLLNSISGIIQDDILINLSATTLPTAPVQLLHLPLEPDCPRINILCDLAYSLQNHKALRKYALPKFLLLATDIVEVKKMFFIEDNGTMTSQKPPNGGVIFPHEIDLEANDKLMKYQLISMINLQPKHAFAVVRYGKTWYWCNDQLVFELEKFFFDEAHKNGFFYIPEKSLVPDLYGRFLAAPRNEYAIPAVFLYELIS